MVEIVQLPTKHCTKCGELKPLADFYRQMDSVQTRCKACVNIKLAKYRSANIEKIRERDRNRSKKIQHNGLPLYKEKNLQHLYGLTGYEYNQMLKQQKYKCACCEKPFDMTKKRPIHVDHDHATGIVRGLTCNNCNHILGRVNDSKFELRKLIKYLVKKR